MAYITNRRLFENAFEIAAKEEQVSAVLRRSQLKLSSKINVYLHGETGVGKTKLLERNSKSGTRKSV